MEPRIESFPGRLLAGKKLKMSMSNDRTVELWRSFMPERNRIEGRRGNVLYSVEVYPESYFVRFDPGTEFEKWAAVEVNSGDLLPEGMEALIIPEGLYAVFTHRGTAAEAPGTYGYIFGTWLPSSGFVTDDRPHFAVMGEQYRPDDPASEEQIWIPVKRD